MEYRSYYPESRSTHPAYVTFARFAMLVFVIGSVISMMIYPHYDPRKKYISELGADSSSVYLFTTSVFLTAIALVPAFLGIYAYLKGVLDDKSRPLMKIGVMFGIMSSIFLVLIGAFPAEGGTLHIHMIIAAIYFPLLALSLFFISITVIYIEDYIIEPPSVDRMNYIGMTFIPFVILFMDIKTWYNVILQKFIVYGAILFLLYIVEKVRKIPMRREFYYMEERPTLKPLDSLDQVILVNRINF